MQAVAAVMQHTCELPWNAFVKELLGLAHVYVMFTCGVVNLIPGTL